MKVEFEIRDKNDWWIGKIIFSGNREVFEKIKTIIETLDWEIK